MMKPLIISEETDKSCDLVCSWLQKWRHPYVRENSENFLNPEVVVREFDEDTSVLIKTRGRFVELNDIQTVWFRRGYLYIRLSYYGDEISEEVSKELNKHIENESSTLTNYIYAILSSKTKINHPDRYNYNKLNALHEAARLGLRIPKTLVSGDGNVIQDFIRDSGTCITKSIQDISSITVDGVNYSIGKITQVKAADITGINYWYSLFQEEIPKRYELRTFYWLGKMYTMAIFSQMDPKSRLDFRGVDVNGLHANRMVPYTLPKNIRLKINRLMKKLKLESGSIDMIVTPTNEYVFLEVNPVGQFNFVSELCNYYIEKNIAEFFAR